MDACRSYFCTAGYTLILDEGKGKAGGKRVANLQKAEEWKRRVEEGVKRNYSEINRIVQEHTLPSANSRTINPRKIL